MIYVIYCGKTEPGRQAVAPAISRIEGVGEAPYLRNTTSHDLPAFTDSPVVGLLDTEAYANPFEIAPNPSRSQ